MKNDYYYKGIHYIEYQGLLDNQPIVKLNASDFELMRNYIEKLEMKIWSMNGEHFGSLKEKK